MVACNVYQGGLMRCCLATLNEAMNKRNTEPEDGEAMDCQYCKNPMIYHGDGWHWDRETCLSREDK